MVDYFIHKNVLVCKNRIKKYNSINIQYKA